jgi:tetratricopeptide (TPR) repeat protein
MTGKDRATDDGTTYETAALLHRQGRLDRAERAYEAVLAADPGHVEALHGLGILSLQSGKTDRAVTYLRRAVSAGGSVTVSNNLGVALCAVGQYDEAIAVYREALRRDPGSVFSLVNLGKLLNFRSVSEEAVAVLEKAVRLSANDAAAHNQLAAALAACGRNAESLAHYEKAVALSPKRSDFLGDLGAAYLMFDRPDKAADCYRRALGLAPGSPAFLCGLGEALGRLNRPEEAVAQFRQAVAQDPDYAPAYYNCGTALTYLGRMAEAKEAFARAARIAPDNPVFQSALIGLEKTAAGNEHLKRLEAMVAEANRPAAERMELDFTLAKAYEDIGDFARAFAALDRGNAAKRRQSRYRLQRDLDRFRAIKETFAADFLAGRSGRGAIGEVPVFVVGMPRSGTTLVEQILASHPAVFGAGEQGILPDLINAGLVGRDFPSSAGALSAEAWSAVGAAYLHRLCALAPDAARITDKLPLNFQLIGLIRLALPKARIVHVVRDPLDTCFSCYSILFEDPALDFSCDLADLGRYYRGYESLMAHWRAVLPPGAMLEIRYEKLVDDFEAEARRLVDFCGLDWDARCLKFYETVRPVETASAMQVRQPLYRKSVGRAARYAPWLEPLKRALAGDAGS